MSQILHIEGDLLDRQFRSRNDARSAEWEPQERPPYGHASMAPWRASATAIPGWGMVMSEEGPEI